MEFTAIDGGHQILVTKRSIVLKLLLGTRLALLFLILACICGVEGITFSFNGFISSEAIYIVPNDQLPPESGWQYYANEYGNETYYHLDTSQAESAGRIVYPGPVQMRDPVTTAVKSFSTTFIYQIFIPAVFPGTGSGLAFMMVPDNFTIGAPQDYMGLITATNAQSTKNVESDAHTFGVELDTYMNPNFSDPNANHFGIDLGSMNSTFTLVPETFSLTTENELIFQQIWIDYLQVDSRINLYYSKYGQGKPATPQGTWAQVNLSLLNEYMYIGFSAAIGIEGSNVHKILAWSFSNEGDAPPILITRDAAAVPPVSSPVPPPA